MVFLSHAEYLIDKLKEYFEATTINELAEKIGVSQPTISAWKNRNSVGAIKNICKDFGIYHEIFETEESINTLNQITERNKKSTVFNQHGANSQQIQNQYNEGDGVKIGGNSIENEFQPLFDALVSIAKALKKEDILKNELKKLMSELPLK